MRSNGLKQLAREFANAEFPEEERDFHCAEGLLLETALTGQMAKCYELNNAGNNPAAADQWGTERQLRAKLINWLCTDSEALKYVHRFGIQVSGADVTGELDLSYASIPVPLMLQHCRLRQPLKLVDAELPQLDLSASFSKGVMGQGLTVKHDVLLNNGFTCEGEISLFHAQIGGVLDCTSGRFSNPFRKDTSASGVALQLKQLKVGGAIYLNEVTVCGAVRLLYSHIDGYLDCSGGLFRVPLAQQDMDEIGTALSAQNAFVKGGVFLRNGFTAFGGVSLAVAEIGGLLSLEGGNFWDADIDLRNASATALYDSGLNNPPVAPPTQWPQRGHIDLDGFTYGRISSPGQIDVAKRLAWLELQQQPPFRSQPYLHLAKVLEDSGNSDARLVVLVHMEHLRRKYQDSYIERPASLAYGVLVGYGYHPLWAVAEIIGLGTLGWIIYRRSYLAGGIVPTDKDAYLAFRESGSRLPGHYPNFSPLIYSVENSLPLVKLGQVDHWQPDPDTNQLPKGKSIAKLEDRSGEQIPESTLQANALACKAAPGELDGPKAVPSLDAEGQTIELRISSKTGTRKRIAALKGLLLLVNAAVKRMLSAVGLQPLDGASNTSLIFSRYATSPRFVRRFRWIQILLGWLLATLFVAGVAGIVHKE